MQEKILIWTSAGIREIDKKTTLKVLLLALCRHDGSPHSIHDIRAAKSVSANCEYITCIQMYDDNVIRLHLYYGVYYRASIFITNIEDVQNIKLEFKKAEIFPT